ncbi:hypothetical protein DDZ18_10620 [Marinicauda salina]|uniref:SPOR domain-containing protein n=1 Tax=Marinicauda salina TaxID=2135793 RepID=A0A2U2BT02_9PROT|nr:SPOR domain-containing protein [Marinicauda salina]PWE17142.1 hypothetical protein DDZ18_10620 [Marinicauda salina]
MSDEEKRLGAYAPPAEDQGTFDAREADADRRGPILLLASAAVFLLFVAVVWSAYNQGVRDRGESPIVSADDEPYREAPDDPGGYETPGQDIDAYSLREEGDDAESSEAGVRPGPEEPAETEREMPPVRVETADADAAQEEAEPEPDPAPAESEPAPEPEPEATSEPAPEPEPEPTPAASEPEPAAAAASAEGEWVVQIAAFRSAEDAEAGWISFATRFPDLARGRAPDIERADLGERGVYHRLRIAAFTSRQSAANYCEALTAEGQSCLVARR